MQRSWYKVTVVVLLLYSCIAGLWMPVPRLPILNETIRNVYFHVPVWFGLIVMCAYSAYGALRYLKNASAKWDQVSHTAAQTAMFLSVPGILTGSIWAKFTWGTWWTFQDPKLNGVALSILIYGAYFILRSAAHEPHKKAQLSAVYNIFAFVMLILFLLVLPRLTASLH
ncbi:MAG: cytochrome c biogenesis protein CcsA, partial [Bacteroidia bacterium]